MSFSVDKQTLDDLNIFNKKGRDSVYGLFNRSRTRGGAEILEQMFRYPLSDAGAINQRSQLIRFFQDSKISFPFKGEWFDLIEQYLSNVDERTKLGNEDNKLGRKFNSLIGADTEYRQIEKAVAAAIDFLNAFGQFTDQLTDGETSIPYQVEATAIRNVLADAELQQLLVAAAKEKLSYDTVAAYDKVLRFKKKDLLQKMLHFAYHLDVYIAIASVAETHNFVFPKALPSADTVMKLEGVYHPLVENAIGNDLLVTPESNFIFLTGANMAGKSTFMKSLGIAVFLAHMGFPVAASSMEFPVMEGLFTTINLPDNLSMGYSHFYAEVLRVKKVAEQLALSKKIFVIFDELFRGTNVKDAYEATVALTAGFAKKRDCIFVISTHIIEAGEELKGRCNNIQFTYLPTLMEGTKPVYTYKLKQGITEDRHGMIIINNEGIVESLRAGQGAERIKEQGLRSKVAAQFVTDKQTLDDLNLLGKYRNNSVLSLFNSTKTAGGERLLEAMFQQPLTDVKEIDKRSVTFKYFEGKALEFPFDQEQLVIAGNYLTGASASNLLMATVQTGRRKLLSVLGLKEEKELVAAGLNTTLKVLNEVHEFVAGLLQEDPESPFSPQLKNVVQIFEDQRLKGLKKLNAEPGFFSTVQYDFLLRSVLREQMEIILQFVHSIDVNIAVADVSRKKGFSYAKALPASEHALIIEQGFHPCLENAVPNSVGLDENNNVIFLTGANMAGKSTYMKSFGTAIYLAHMGFPVPAKSMVFSVKDGMYTSINVPDDLNMGYSHFYAEVLRVKQIAEEVSSPKNLIVIVDELFKGTNVKDAYDATLEVSTAFSEHSNCFFIISTHIVEVGEALGQSSKNVKFTYMPTEMKGSIPTYTYRATEGISSDRHGMMIIENEGILELVS
ncbi:hypothetical protein LPB86_08985 [Pedobacter sp. MC2016-14]|uniref:MutS-related protein n=1 Tax=Pedobacter sp. MC2016-14 TaxID=2897327 RepID=UPI001E64F0B0|nr:hypothetical protein [Pedobacter sp. MC2016-14]MCD0488363.1 hypothetical protein [Pedobacter sp. MC2016-14]